MLKPRGRMLRALPVLPLVVLAGCGIAGTQFHPGIAAEVGDQTISTRHVATVTDDYCQAVEKVSEGQPPSADTVTPMRYLAHTFTIDLVVRAAAEQLAEEYGVRPGQSYQDNLAQLEPQLAPLTEDQKEAVREVVAARAYASDVLPQIGEISLKKQGKTDANADEQLAEGQRLLQQWADDHDVEVNPRYGIEIGSQDEVDTDLSYPLSTTAKDGLESAPGSSIAAGLPGHLTCLD